MSQQPERESPALPLEAPVADAVEQQRQPIDSPEDEEAAVTDADGPPLEASAPDWQEQRAAVELDDDDVRDVAQDDER